jgi:hypothetical protein
LHFLLIGGVGFVIEKIFKSSKFRFYDLELIFVISYLNCLFFKFFQVEELSTFLRKNPLIEQGWMERENSRNNSANIQKGIFKKGNAKNAS